MFGSHVGAFSADFLERSKLLEAPELPYTNFVNPSKQVLCNNERCRLGEALAASKFYSIVIFSNSG